MGEKGGKHSLLARTLFYDCSMQLEGDSYATVDTEIAEDAQANRSAADARRHTQIVG